MTQERMIRIHFEGNSGIAVMGVSDVGQIFIRFENTEPAPPKDWRPRCYYEIRGNDAVCRGITRYSDSYDVLRKSCIECIYRKKE